MTIDEAINKAGEANAALLSALQDIQSDPRVSDRLVITSAMKALQRCVGAEGLSPSARNQVSSALEMCRAALGLSS